MHRASSSHQARHATVVMASKTSYVNRGLAVLCRSCGAWCHIYVLLIWVRHDSRLHNHLWLPPSVGQWVKPHVWSRKIFAHTLQLHLADTAWRHTQQLRQSFLTIKPLTA